MPSGALHDGEAHEIARLIDNRPIVAWCFASELHASLLPNYNGLRTQHAAAPFPDP